MTEAKIKDTVRDVMDFPKAGIIFKDITPILKDPQLCHEITVALANQLKDLQIDVVAGIESRGFFFGLLLAQALGVPFVPIRKAGKLPYKTIRQSYALEYGEATLELHEDAIVKGQRVLIHDDLLATGGTVVAAAQLIAQLDGEVAGCSFIIALDFLNGRAKLTPFTPAVFALASY